MTLAAPRRMTLDEFLALPDDEPRKELVSGRVLEKAAPSERHSRLVVEVSAQIVAHLCTCGDGRIDIDLRHLHEGEQRVFLPDVSVTLKHRLPPIDQNPVTVMPDLVIEVVSPGDRPGRFADKMLFYNRIGIPLMWVIDPEEETLTAYRPGELGVDYTAADTVRADPVLPDFVLDLGELFAVLHSEGESTS